LIAFMVAMLLLLLATWSAAHGVADLYGMRGRAYLERWERQEAPPGETALADARIAFEVARFLEPRDPRLAQDFGRALEWRAFRKDSADPRARAALSQALAQFRLATILRPMWPYSWAAIASVKLRLQEFDAELARAVERAVTLGPWEPEVQLAIARVRLLGAELLPTETRNLAQLALRRTLRVQAKNVIPLAVQLGEQDLIQALAEDDERTLELLARELDKAKRL
jgi:hypothetical protein